MMRKLYLVLIIVTAMIVGWGLNDVYHEYSQDMYTCQFERMTSTFEATHREVYNDSSHITVHIGERTFMFKRSNLVACFQLLPEDYEQS